MGFAAIWQSSCSTKYLRAPGKGVQGRRLKWIIGVRSSRQSVMLIPALICLAEAYWGNEQKLQEQGFDFCYDKHLYDEFRSADVAGVRRQSLGVGCLPGKARALPREP